MPRYVIERDFAKIGDSDMEEIGARSKRVATERFPDITWEHSHVCIDAAGGVRSFCVYTAPNEQRLHEHAEELGRHVVTNMYEIVGDVDPREIAI